VLFSPTSLIIQILILMKALLKRIKLIIFGTIAVLGFIVYLWYPRIEQIPILYPGYNFYTGQSLSEVKRILGDKIYEPDNNAGRQNCRYIVFNDTALNPQVRIHSLMTFYKNHLVSFYCQFKAKDSTYNLTEWLIEQYSESLKSYNCKSFTRNDKLRYKLHQKNIFIHLAIDKKYSKYSASTYLVGDYRYKEIDWD
jgi:hypothetical protein